MPSESRSDQAVPSPHPVGQLEGFAYGWLAEAEVRAVEAHVAGCPSCQSLVADAEAIRARLALLGSDEPKIDVLDRVLRRIEGAGNEDRGSGSEDRGSGIWDLGSGGNPRPPRSLQPPDRDP